MQGTRVEEKVKIFISSICDGRYMFVREALRLLLLETGMCEVYMFEEEGATTDDVVSSYMRKLERSDIIIFLIDNKDDISEGTMREVKRGRELKKKCLFLFCDEHKKEPTELQKEIMSMKKGEKYKVISRFVKFPEIAYESMINDIINTYLNYCNKKIERDDSEEESNSVENTMGDIHTILNKETFKGCNYTKWILNCEVSIGQEYPKKIDSFDRMASDLFCVILGNKSIEDIDFEEIKCYVNNMHKSGRMQKAIILRMNAMESYWKGEINEAISFLSNALEIAVGTKYIPQWFVNNIAIDLRNMNAINDREHNIINFSSQGQNVINESKEPVFFPVVDRFLSNFYENVTKGMLDNVIAQPFTIKLGGVDNALDHIVDIYVAALLYGSIAHTVMIREKLATYLQGLCMHYREHKLFVTTIKLLLLLGDEKKLKKFTDSYGGYTENVNSEDINEWINAVSMIKIKYLRFNSSCLLLGFWGSYFSEQQFKDLYNDLKNDFFAWTDEKFAGDIISKAYLSVLEKNQFRINQKDFLEIAYLYFEKGLKRWYDDVFGLLGRIQLKRIGDLEIKEYVSWLVECVNDEEIVKQCNNLPKAIQNVRLQRQDVSELDDVVKETFEYFYNNEYSLNVFEHDSENIKLHINKLIDSIKSQNETQGKSGCYIGYADNPYRTIENILVIGNVKVPVKIIGKILSAALGTLRAKRQTLESKVDAWKLITIVFLMYPKAKCVKEAYDDINNNLDIFLHAEDILLFSRYKDSSLQIIFQYWKIFTNQIDELSVIEVFANISKDDTSEIITDLSLLEGLLVVAEKLKLSVAHSKYMLQSLMEFSRNQNSDVRFYAYISLIKIMNINPECKELILMRLSEAMDGEVYKNKVAILSRLSKKKDEKIQYIFSKGKVDNHFWVRDIARKYVV